MTAKPPRPSLPSAHTGRAARYIALVLEVLWTTLLVLPAALTTSAMRVFDQEPGLLFAVSCWVVLGTRLLFPRRAYFFVTLPVVLLGVACTGAELLRGVDLLGLLGRWHTFTALEIAGTARPYAWATLGTCLVLGTLAFACHRFVPEHTRPRAVAWGVVAATALLATAVPRTVWLRTWPIDGILLVGATASGSNVMTQYLFPELSYVDPRDPGSSWGASRVPGAPAAETVVLLIGETIRPDYLRECGGPARVRPLSSGARVACDVTAGSDGTSESVPLLISREMPGHRVRVSTDATFVHALQEAGFEGHWIGVQPRSVAWPDATVQLFRPDRGRDDAVLLPPLATALARPAPLKAIVLHANNAHTPYCSRYDRAQAPYPVDCSAGVDAVSPANLAQVRASYANAVDASVGLLDDVIDALSRRPEPTFLVYAPDHGENLLDDGRELWNHALRRPTRWDARVPVVFWANDAWRAGHAAQWARLESQLGAPLMHADLVPTLLDAAGVRYDEPRKAPVDLLASTVPPQRHRIVQQALDDALDWTTLEAEARAAGPGPAASRPDDARAVVLLPR